MRKRSLLGLALGLAVAVAVAVVGKLPTRADEAKETGKGKRAQAFIEAFDKGEAKTCASFWTEAGDYVDQTGRQYKGRDAIEKLYKKVFSENKGAKLTITVSALRKVTDDVAIEDGTTQVTPADGGLPTVGRFSAVLVKKDGEWYFEHVRETIATPPNHSEHFDDLEWIIGDWVGEGEKGEQDHASYEWDENQNFIVSTFATTLKGIPLVGGTVWIGWDAAEKKIRSWSFYSGGGFGQAEWTRDGDKWSIKTTAQTADGKKVTVTNILTKVDADNATWQRTGLTVDGKELPDGKVMKVKRVKEKE